MVVHRPDGGESNNFALKCDFTECLDFASSSGFILEWVHASHVENELDESMFEDHNLDEWGTARPLL